MTELVVLSLADQMMKAADEFHVTETNAGAPFADSMAAWSTQVAEMQKEADALGAYRTVNYDQFNARVTIQFNSQEEANNAWQALHRMWSSTVVPPVGGRLV